MNREIKLRSEKNYEEVEEAVLSFIKNLERLSEEKQLAHSKKIKSLQKMVSHMEESVVSERKKISELKKQISHLTEARSSENVKNLKKKYSLYSSIQYHSKKLGLDIKKLTPYSLEFVFYYINIENTEHRIVLNLDDDSVYSVTDCFPFLSNIPELVEELNQNNDVSTFIRSVRRSFKLLYPI